MAVHPRRRSKAIGHDFVVTLDGEFLRGGAGPSVAMKVDSQKEQRGVQPVLFG